MHYYFGIEVKLSQNLARQTALTSKAVNGSKKSSQKSKPLKFLKNARKTQKHLLFIGPISGTNNSSAMYLSTLFKKNF